MKKKISSEVKTGILVTLTIGGMIWGFNLLKGRNFFHDDRDLYAVYKNIDGLTTNNPLFINGFKAGQVREVHLYPDNSGRIVVHFAITENNFFIPTNSVAHIISDGLLGSKAIALELGNGKVNAKQGDTLNGETQASIGEQISTTVKPLKERAQVMINAIDSVMGIVQTILNKDVRHSLSASFESVRKAIATLEKTAGKLDNLVESEGGKISSILSKMDKITGVIAANSDKLGNILKNFSTLSDSLAKSEIAATIKHTNTTIIHAADILDKINKGEGSIGLLLKDKKLYNDLDSASSSLNRLFNDMNLHPKRYIHFSVFGRKEKKASKAEINDLNNKVNAIQKENDDLKKQMDMLQNKQ